MANARITIYGHKFVFGNSTFDKSSGGPFEWNVEKVSQSVKERLELLFPIYVEQVDGELNLSVTMKDVGQSFTIGQSGAATVYAKAKATEYSLSLGTLVVTDVIRSQGRAAPGSLTVKFTAETAAGADPDEKIS